VRELQADIDAYQAGFATTAENAGAVKQTVLLLKRQRLVAGVAIAAVATLAVFAAQLIRDRHEAEQTLQRLRTAAPALAEQARTFLTHGQTHEAVEKIAYAVDLAPEKEEYVRLQGDALTADLELSAAAAAYRHALALRADDPLARNSLTLLDRLLSDHPNGDGLTQRDFKELASLAQQQGRPEAGIYRTLAATTR
jgi:hypothetical protein